MIWGCKFLFEYQLFCLDLCMIIYTCTRLLLYVKRKKLIEKEGGQGGKIARESLVSKTSPEMRCWQAIMYPMKVERAGVSGCQYD